MKSTPDDRMMMRFDESAEFQKECKHLSKKYKSLPTDLEGFRSILSANPLGNTKHFHVIKRSGGVCVIKSRLFCRYLKGSSLRIVYAYTKQSEHIEFIEVYFKGDKESEDGDRIKKHFT